MRDRSRHTLLGTASLWACPDRLTAHGGVPSATSAPGAAETLDRRSRRARPGAAWRRPCRAIRRPSCGARGIGQISTQARGPSQRLPRTRRSAPRGGGPPWSRASHESEIRHTEEVLAGDKATAPGGLRPAECTFRSRTAEVVDESHLLLRYAQIFGAPRHCQPKAEPHVSTSSEAGSTDAQTAKNKVCPGVHRRRAAHSPITPASSARNLERHLSTPPASARC